MRISKVKFIKISGLVLLVILLAFTISVAQTKNSPDLIGIYAGGGVFYPAVSGFHKTYNTTFDFMVTVGGAIYINNKTSIIIKYSNFKSSSFVKSFQDRDAILKQNFLQTGLKKKILSGEGIGLNAKTSGGLNFINENNPNKPKIEVTAAVFSLGLCFEAVIIKEYLLFYIDSDYYYSKSYEYSSFGNWGGFSLGSGLLIKVF